MKKILMFTALASTLVLAACGGDDSDSTATKKWNDGVKAAESKMDKCKRDNNIDNGATDKQTATYNQCVKDYYTALEKAGH